jgi:4-hydroxythreonine-4-phosphate dehydrogenase
MLANFACEEAWQHNFSLIGDLFMLRQRAALLGLNVLLEDADDSQTTVGSVKVKHIPLGAACIAGELNIVNAAYVLATLDEAIAGCMEGRYAAMVTAPLQKSVICDAGFTEFTGHTEYLAEKTQTPHVVMMLASGDFRVALATTHLPLAKVAQNITQPSLQATLTVLLHSLKNEFGCSQPHVLVAGLNPHAGESGHLGHEETEIIAPVLNEMRAAGHHLTGPLPADTLFQPKYLGGADAVLAMYHDQGLPVLKYASFGRGVNITLGLPLIRTSVDHGTALELAGTGKAMPDSLLAAYDQACYMIRHKSLNA